MTSATERLRALLDERGIKWTEPNNDERSRTTHWTAGLLSCIAVEFYDGTVSVSFTAHRVTPELAIKATLGSGECRNLIAHVQSQMPMLHCEECGCTTMLNVPSGGAGYIGETTMEWPLYCANCGRKVRV